MNKKDLINKSLSFDLLSKAEGMWLYQNLSLAELMEAAHEVRMKLHPNNIVTWLIDRNVNITNVCISNCRFCNFHCKPNDEKQYITTYEEPAEYKSHDPLTCKFCQNKRPEPGQTGLTGLLDGQHMFIKPEHFDELHNRGGGQHRLRDENKWKPLGIGAGEAE